MLRFLLFVVLALLLGRILRALFVALTRHAGSSRKPGGKYGVGTNDRQQPVMEFKDVKDAEFEEITEPEKPPK